MKITILDDYQNVVKDLKCFDTIKNQEVEIINYTEKNIDKLAELLSETEILILIRERTSVSAELLEKLPNLKLISQTGKISNHLKLETCTQYKVAVAEGIGSPIAPAELTWNLIMNTVRKLPQAIDGMKDGNWQTNIGNTIYGKTLGIWGYGKIGQKIAQYAKVFGADVVIWGSENAREKAQNDGFLAAKSKEDFFQTIDIFTTHLRLNEATKGIIKQNDLALMKENASFINTARAELVEENALINILKSGQKINIGLDVYENEPVTDQHFELLQYLNVICVPHMGYVEMDSYELYFSKAFENALNFINNTPTNIANPEIL